MHQIFFSFSDAIIFLFEHPNKLGMKLKFTLFTQTSLCDVYARLLKALKEKFIFEKTFADNLLTPMSSKMLESRKEIKGFDENIPGFSPYNALYWEPNG